MLNLYYGRESLDKDKFLFDRIGGVLKEIEQGESGVARVLLLVPDQFTLQAERNAFACLGVPGLIDLDILSPSRLGYKVLAETGGSTRLPIDKYGRHMLLTKILAEEDEHLKAFKGMKKRHSFVDKANDLISEMKQYNTSPEDLLRIMEETDEHAILRRKLWDIHQIYSKYETLIAGKYIDTEDYLKLFTDKISSSHWVKTAEVWISGFDYFTPKTVDIIHQLMRTAASVNLVMTADEEENRDGELFGLTRNLIYKLKALAEESRVPVAITPIDGSCLIPVGHGDHEKSPSLAHLEKEIYAHPDRKLAESQDITLCGAANIYAEVETAAAAIVDLIRDKGLRYRDIAVICNDMEARASVIKRVFADHGISMFLDKKRDVLHNPAITFVSALMDILSKGWLAEDIFRLLKTNMTPLEPETYEDLENYIIKYRIRGNRWKSDFKYGLTEEGEEELARLNESRALVYQYIWTFEKAFNKAKTVKEKTAALYYFLRDVACLPEKIQQLMTELMAENHHEIAEETAQIWGVIINILDQLTELIGEEEITNEDYGSILRAGFEAVEIGLLPPTIDQVVVGTMQRTRTGALKALFVIGANDGLLPGGNQSEGLLSEDEKAALMKKNIEICKIDDLRAKEERLAIYKLLSKPSKYLWMGYSASDIEGKESRQSLIFDKMRKLFPNIEVEKDIFNRRENLLRIETPKSTLRHLSEAFRNTMDGEELKEEWQLTYGWYVSEGEEALRALEEGLFFTNKQDKLEKELIDKLYRKEGLAEIILSPSRLEKFSRCAFAHFISYALRPEERRVFEIAGREIGDIYHQCLMRLSQELTMEGLDITHESSPWMRLTKEECQEKMDRLIDEEAQVYKEGMLVQGEEERYRSSRMKKVCGNAAWALVEHVQKGRIKKVYFESQFGRGRDKEFPPIEVALKDQRMLIEGKIDRVDILQGSETEYVKIIDYKSGKERFDIEEVKKGWRLQLMLYLQAAMDPVRKPAGVFYFEIAEPQIDATALTADQYAETVKAEMMKSFKLDGVVLNEASVIEGIAGEFTGYSEVLPVKKTKDGTYAGTTESKLLDEEAFCKLQDAVKETIQDLCQELAEGTIDITPKKVKDETACKFCPYKGICYFDLSFEGCKYQIIK